ncbi:unnamed protein product [Protopolystoma xenopodis]|uniref:Uncharacterized protein n=1 Tax=Protopolystoma xenopodis TaxID=117903 RepID=A0A448WYB6_9PLAT|nr:unnamed protein product [Protopolystoma xenopodis]
MSRIFSELEVTFSPTFKPVASNAALSGACHPTALDALRPLVAELTSSIAGLNDLEVVPEIPAWATYSRLAHPTRLFCPARSRLISLADKLAKFPLTAQVIIHKHLIIIIISASKLLLAPL